MITTPFVVAMTMTTVIWPRLGHSSLVHLPTRCVGFGVLHIAGALIDKWDLYGAEASIVEDVGPFRRS